MFELNMRINVIMECSTSHFEMFSKLTLECLHSDLNSPLMSERALVWSQEDTKWGRAPGVKKKNLLWISEQPELLRLLRDSQS